jgi:hypothetical protein
MPAQSMPWLEEPGGDDGTYCDYLTTEAAYQGRLWGEVSGRRWQHSYMRVLATKKAQYDNFCKRLEEVARKAMGDEELRARPIVIAYGAGKLSSAKNTSSPCPPLELAPAAGAGALLPGGAGGRAPHVVI